MTKANFTPTTKIEIIERINDTFDYNDYELINGNRNIDMSQVNKLIDSFKMYGTTTARILVVRTKSVRGIWIDFILDGQHRRKAANILGLPLSIDVIMFHNDEIENILTYVAALNNVTKSWSTNNLLKLFANDLKIEEYVKLLKIKKETKLTITDLLTIYVGGNAIQQRAIFASGKLKFPNEAKSDALLKAVLSVRNVIPNKAFSRRSFFKISNLMSTYHKFSKAILKASKSVTFVENEKQFFSQLVTIYTEMK